MKQLHEIRIPFTGFYETEHGYAFDQEVEDVLGEYPNETYPDLGLDFEGYKEEYSEEYTQVFEDYIRELSPCLNISLKYLETDSPKEYNFTTDIITALISEEDISKLTSYIVENCLNNLGQIIKSKFTSRSGFISFYSPVLGQKEWRLDNVPNWTDVQLGTLLEALVEDNLTEIYIERTNEIAMNYVNPTTEEGK